MTRTMLAALEAELGTAERPGADANPRILEYFAAAGLEPDQGDEEAWCGAALAWAAREAGHAPPAQAYRARHWAAWGNPLEKPVKGCVVVLRRTGNPKLGHVGLFIGQAGGAGGTGRIYVLGGNQGDRVCIVPFPAADVIAYRWPAGAPVDRATPRHLDAAGSRITRAAKRQQTDAAKATGAGSTTTVPVAPAPTPAPAAPPAPPVSQAPDPQGLPADAVDWGWIANRASSAKGTLETLFDFAGFVWARWPWVAGAVALYFAARIAYDGWRIRRWRTEDHNDGRHTGRATA